MPATLSVLTNVFTDAAERAKAIAIWAGVSALGIAIGPIAGGWLLEHFSWGSVFLVNVPIVIVALSPVAGRWCPSRRDPAVPRLDLVGAVLSIVGTRRARLRHHRGAGAWLDLDPTILGWFVGAAIVLGSFVRLGAAQRPPDARRAGSSPTPGSRRRACR